MTKILPGGGSFYFNGYTWSLDFALNAQRDGFDVPGGAQTIALQLFNGRIYAQDATHGRWWVWNDRRDCFLGPVADPP